jgi:hypothetical protein
MSQAIRSSKVKSAEEIEWRSPGHCFEALSSGPLGPLGRLGTTADTAGLLDPAQITRAQTVICGGVLARSLEAMLPDGGTNLIALTARWSALCVALGR